MEKDLTYIELLRVAGINILDLLFPQKRSNIIRFDEVYPLYNQEDNKVLQCWINQA